MIFFSILIITDLCKSSNFKKLTLWVFLRKVPISISINIPTWLFFDKVPFDTIYISCYFRRVCSCTQLYCLDSKIPNISNITSNMNYTSNGGCRREEKSRKHWSLFTMLLSSVTEFFLFVRSNQKQLYVLIALKIREK